ncbi:MAG: HAMP domain-containing sensor histidine kinase [Candidatus Omnitrophota bacterium]
MKKTNVVVAPYKNVVIAVLFLTASASIYYFHLILRTEVVYTHLFYVPIILAAVWWERKVFWVVLFLAVQLLGIHFFVDSNFSQVMGEGVRVAMFFIIGFLISTLSEESKKRGDLLEVAGRELEKKVELRTAELSETNARLALEIAAHKKTEESLRKASETVKKMNEQMKSFVANVSHEIRGPLSIIKESFDIIHSGTVGEINEEQKRCLSAGERTADRLIRLLGDLLSLAKLEAGHMQLQKEMFAVAPFVDEIMVSYRGQISKKGLTFKLEMAPDLGAIRVDRDRISEVIINLLNNAIKYTPSGGTLTVKLEGNREEVRFEIADTGPGIPKAFLTKVFDKFERITAEKQEGTGLGLPIAKEIVELHRGKIWVESEPGKGSHFIFILPRNVAQDR